MGGAASRKPVRSASIACHLPASQVKMNPGNYVSTPCLHNVQKLLTTSAQYTFVLSSQLAQFRTSRHPTHYAKCAPCTLGHYASLRTLPLGTFRVPLLALRALERPVLGRAPGCPDWDSGDTLCTSSRSRSCACCFLRKQCAPPRPPVDVWDP